MEYYLTMNNNFVCIKNNNKNTFIYMKIGIKSFLYTFFLNSTQC